MSEELLIEYGKLLLTAGIPSFIILRAMQMTRWSLRNGKREIALIFIAYACALAAATIAYFTTKGLRQSIPFQWMVGLCLVYGIVHLLVRLTSSNETSSKGAVVMGAAATVTAGAGIGTSELLDPLDPTRTSFDPPDDPLPDEIYNPAYSFLVGNINHSIHSQDD